MDTEVDKEGLLRPYTAPSLARHQGGRVASPQKITSKPTEEAAC